MDRFLSTGASAPLLVYGSSEERRRAIADFVEEARQKRERLLVIASPAGLRLLLDDLRALGVEGEGISVLELTPAATLLSALETERTLPLPAGFSGLRVLADLTCASSREAALDLARAAASLTDECGLPRLFFFEERRDAGQRKPAPGEDRFRAAFEFAPVGMCLEDLSGRYLEVNKALCEMLGYTEAELVGRNFRDVTYPEDVSESETLIQRIANADERCIRLEKRYIAKSGRTVWAELTGTAILDAAGRPTHLITQVQDVTEKRRAARELERKNRMMAALNRISNIGFDREQVDGICDGICSEVRSSTGYALVMLGVADARGNIVPKCCSGDPTTEERASMRAVCAGIPAPEQCVPGSLRTVLRLPVEIEGRLSCVLCLADRISHSDEEEPLDWLDALAAQVGQVVERARWRSTLSESEERLRLALEASNGAHWVWRPQTGEIYFSPRYFTMLGYEPDEFTPTPGVWEHLLHPEDRKETLGKLLRAVASSDATNMHKFRMLTKSGGYVWVLGCGRVLERDAEGNALCVAGVNLDVTDVVEKEEELRTVLELSPDGFIAFDGEGRIVDANEVYSRMSGYGRDELKELSISDLLTEEEDRAKRPGRMRDVRERHSQRFTTKHRRKDGSSFEAEVAAAYEPSRGGVYLEFVRDVTARNEADRKLRESEVRYRAFSALTSDYVYICERAPGAPYRLKWVGGAFERISGYSSDEILARGCAISLFHPDDVERVSESLESLRPGEEKTNEFRLMTKDGTIRWIRDHNRCEWNEQDPGTYRLFGAAEDITSAMEARERLRIISTAVTQSPASVVITDTKGTIEYVNPMFTELTGYTPQEALGKSPSLLKSGKLAKEFYAGLWRTIESGEVWHGEFLNKKKNGELYWELASISPISDSTGRITHFVAVKENITERKHTEEALRQSEERLRLVIEGSSDGYWDADLRTGVVTVSARCAEILSMAPDALSLTVKECYERVHPDDFAAFQKAGAAYATGSAPQFAAEHRFRTEKGDYRWLHTRGRVVEQEADGIPRRAAGVISDISDRKQMEAEQERLKEQLLQAQRLESVGRLAGGIAHDFNNLLTVINGYSNLMMAQLRSDDPLSEGIRQVNAAGERAAELTRQLLAFSRQQVVRTKVVCMGSIVRNLEKLLTRLIGEHIELSIRVGDGGVPVKADPAQVEQVVMNLAVNARDAMPKGGRISIEVNAIELPGRGRLDGFAGLPAGRYALFTIEDTGHGMEPETQRRIFDPFFTTKEVGKGTGLGLSLVYGIVNQYGGDIRVTSAPGRGTRFDICLPLSTAPLDSEAPAKGAEPASGAGTVLLVEDQADVRRLTATILSAGGYEVVEAANGNEAMRVFRTHGGRFDLLLSDLVMPGMSGVDLARRIREEAPGMSVLFFSGYADLDLSGLPPDVEHLRKPFTPTHLLGKVLESIGSGRKAPTVLLMDDEEAVRMLFRMYLEDLCCHVVECGRGDEALEIVADRKPALLIADLHLAEGESSGVLRETRRLSPETRILAVSGSIESNLTNGAAARLGADRVLGKPVGRDALVDAVKSLLP